MKIFSIVIAGFIGFNLLYGATVSESIKEAREKTKSCPYPWTTADHKKFNALNGPFHKAPEVTKACLKCHNEAALQIQKTRHWKWEYKRGNRVYGKKHVINNFCISVNANYPRCTSCHIGYGWKDKNFDFTKQENVDCLVCHTRDKKYKKFPTDAGHPAYVPKKFKHKDWPVPNLSESAKEVAATQRKNCGVCHFFGGGGPGVKHGDLDPSLFKPKRDLDVHMAIDGGNFACTKCHVAKNHMIKGADPEMGKVSCTTCHTDAPHKTGQYKDILNAHFKKVACQTCHIPAFARKLPTKMWWDWSKAGKKTKDGKILVKKDKNGWMVYHTFKGEFRWQKNVIPEYFFWNGEMDYTLVTDKIDPSKAPITLNPIKGSYEDPNSKIYPFKVHRGKQIYDPVYKNFIKPKLFGPKGSGAYWKDFDWNKAAEAGMKEAGVPYSGKYAFIETRYLWPQNHMVAPKEKALRCNDCHSRESRLKNLKAKGFYLPGRDRTPFDTILWIIAGLTLLGVIGHGTIRIISSSKKEG